MSIKKFQVTVITIAALLCTIACSTANRANTKDTQIPTNPSTRDLKELLGQTVTITGKAVNAKLGALLAVRNGTDVWMDNLQNWPKPLPLAEF
jgi:hypothetical protein